MNQNECPIMVYDPPKGIRSHGWSVGFSPLGAPNSYVFFRQKSNALRFARQQIKAPRCISALGNEIPWDVTVSWKSEGEAREVECWEDARQTNPTT